MKEMGIDSFLNDNGPVPSSNEIAINNISEARLFIRRPNTLAYYYQPRGHGGKGRREAREMSIITRYRNSQYKGSAPRKYSVASFKIMRKFGN